MANAINLTELIFCYGFVQGVQLPLREQGVNFMLSCHYTLRNLAFSSFVIRYVWDF